MALLTKKYISDQILFRLSGGIPDAAFPVDERDIWGEIDRLVNGMFKLQYFNQTLPSGETIPDNLMIGTYENIAVTSLPASKSFATLPITPISLPKNLGIYQIYDAAHPDSPFIPILAGQTALLKTDALLSDLLGQVSFEPKGNKVVFNKDLPLYGVNEVTMELMIFDMSQYGKDDILPIPADMAGDIVNRLVVAFAPVEPETGEVNNFTTAGQNIPMGASQRKF